MAETVTIPELTVMFANEDFDTLAHVLKTKQSDTVTDNEQKRTVLMLACLSNRLDLVCLVVQLAAGKGGFDINEANSEGCSALTCAANDGFVEICDFLISQNADPNHTSGCGSTPLMHACYNGHYSTVELLLKNGARLEERSTDGWSALLFAADAGQKEICRFLIERGALVDAQSFKGWTPLMCAAAKGHFGVAELLLKHGAAADSTDKHGTTALLLAQKQNHTHIAIMIAHKLDRQRDGAKPAVRKRPSRRKQNTANKQPTVTASPSSPAPLRDPKNTGSKVLGVDTDPTFAIGSLPTSPVSNHSNTAVATNAAVATNGVPSLAIPTRAAAIASLEHADNEHESSSSSRQFSAQVATPPCTFRPAEVPTTTVPEPQTKTRRKQATTADEKRRPRRPKESPREVEPTTNVQQTPRNAQLQALLDEVAVLTHKLEQTTMLAQVETDRHHSEVASLQAQLANVSSKAAEAERAVQSAHQRGQQVHAKEIAIVQQQQDQLLQLERRFQEQQQIITELAASKTEADRITRAAKQRQLLAERELRRLQESQLATEDSTNVPPRSARKKKQPKQPQPDVWDEPAEGLGQVIREEQLRALESRPDVQSHNLYVSTPDLTANSNLSKIHGLFDQFCCRKPVTN